jgi:N-acetylmuramoyl-L-alanine amidase
MTFLLLGLSPAAEEKWLAVYSAQTNFTISVIDHDGQEYVSVTDLVDPFGNATLTHKGDRWKLKLAQSQGKAIEAEFRDGADTASVRGKTIHLARAFWADGQRGYVPVASTAVLMAQFTHLGTIFRENSRRLFVGDVSTTYTAEIAKGSPNKLVLHFSSPVNPEVSTEPGRVRLNFNREPLIASGANPQTFESSAIRSSTFSENNGSAEITVATTAPTQPVFSDGRRTITLTASLPTVQAAAPPEKPAAPPMAAAPVPKTSPSAQQSGGGVAPPPSQFTVILDPAHGGDDPGATLGDGLLEKDVTMAVARRIRGDLGQRGIAVILLRDGDSTLTLDQRATAANAARAALYIGIHATTFGSGVHLYSAHFNGDVKPANYGFVPWDSAQAAYLNASHNLQASLVTEFESRQIHSVPLESGLRPLRNVAKPAIVVEVAEPERRAGDVKEGLSSVAYQQAVAAAVGSGIANLRGAFEGHSLEAH